MSPSEINILPDWIGLLTVSPDILVPTLNLWPELRSKTFQVLQTKLSNVKNLDELGEVGDFVWNQVSFIY